MNSKQLSKKQVRNRKEAHADSKLEQGTNLSLPKYIEPS